MAERHARKRDNRIGLTIDHQAGSLDNGASGPLIGSAGLRPCWPSRFTVSFNCLILCTYGRLEMAKPQVLVHWLGSEVVKDRDWKAVADFVAKKAVILRKLEATGWELHLTIDRKHSSEAVAVFVGSHPKVNDDAGAKGHLRELGISPATDVTIQGGCCNEPRLNNSTRN